MITFLSSLSVAQMAGLAVAAFVVLSIVWISWPKNTNSKHFAARRTNNN